MNRFRHFERLKRMPPGFVVVGDAVVAFNPAYGQGMSVAAIEACALQRARRHGPIEPLSFQRTIAREVKDVWLAATGEDFRFNETSGPRPVAARWMHRYLDGIVLLSLRDPQVQAVTAGVYLLDRPMTDLLSPSIMFRALWEMLRGNAAMPETVPLLARRASE